MAIISLLFFEKILFSNKRSLLIKCKYIFNRYIIDYLIRSYNKINKKSNKLNEQLIVLGIESTCDETGASIISIDENGLARTLSNVLKTQFSKHKKFGGVVPEIAARNHLSSISEVVNLAFNKANINLEDIDAVASSCGPGLIGGLIVGSSFGKAISLALNIPFIPINHLEAHVLSPRLIQKVDFPYLVLLISGGHTQILKINDINKVTRLSTTIDDSIGESFDKASIMLDLGWPGGKAIENHARNGDPLSIKLPRPMIGKKNNNFSFSGLKTALYRQTISEPLTEKRRRNLSASFQNAVTDVLEDKCKNIIDLELAKDLKIKNFVVAGGVAANKTIRKRLSVLVKQKDLNIIFPPIELCTDNGVMIAWAGCLRMSKGFLNSLDVSAKARWPLEEVKTE